MLIRERMTTKEREIHGMWMTEERMKKSGDFSAPARHGLWTLNYWAFVTALFAQNMSLGPGRQSAVSSNTAIVFHRRS